MAFQLAMPNDEAPSLAPSFEKPPGSEPDNPTALPFEVLKTYRWTFIIRHPRSSIPSLYRLSMPASREATGWHYYLSQEAGYQELRVLFDYLLSHKLIDQNHVCLIDADDLIAQPAKITERYCKYIGIDYRPEMLRWDTDEDKAHADEIFASPMWIAFHRDALESTGFNARPHIKVSVRIPFFYVERGRRGFALTLSLSSVQKPPRRRTSHGGRNSARRARQLSAKQLMQTFRITST